MLMYNSKNGLTVDPSTVAREPSPVKIPFEINRQNRIFLFKKNIHKIKKTELKQQFKRPQE